MATLIAYQSGNWTGASTWKQIATGTGSVQLTFTSSTATTTSYVYSPTFTVTNTQVIEGLLLYCQRNGTGTVSVALSDDNGVTATRVVTVNATDLPEYPSWVFFKFGTTLTADGGTDYRIGVTSSFSGGALFFRSGTAAAWARLLRQSTTATIAGTDDVYICDELTGQGTKVDIEVTMNQTSSATTYGGINIGQGGVLSYGTSASTNYYLKLAGNINVRGGGTFNIGTTGTPMPRSSTAKLEIVCTSAAQFGLIVLSGGTFNAQGLSRTSGKDVYYCLLNTDEAVNSTSLGVDTDTGWLDNDRIAIAATGSVLAQWEVGTLNGNAGASTLTVDGFAGTGGGLAFAHSGTAPTQAEVALLTRNVEIFGSSRTNTTYLLFNSFTTIDIDWVYIKWIGSATIDREGINNKDAGCDIQYCAIEETSQTTGSFAFLSSVNATFSNNVIYDAGQVGVSITGGFANTTINNNIIIRTALTGILSSSSIDVTVSGNRVSGATTTGISLIGTGAIRNLDNNVIHNCNNHGLEMQTSTGVVNGLVCYHNTLVGGPFAGLNIQTATNITASDTPPRIVNALIFGNFSQNIRTAGGDYFYIFDNCTIAGSDTRSVGNGVITSAGGRLDFLSCTFGRTDGIYAAHTSADLTISSGSCFVNLNNTSLLSTTEILGQSTLLIQNVIGSQKHDQTAGNHRAWKKFGTITTDSTIFKTASPSERLTPNNLSNKLESGTKLVAIENATTKTISVWVRKSVTGDGTNYNGNQPRLRYRRSDAAGVTSDGTLDTVTVANGNWEQLTGTSPAITDNAVLEFFVDCDGTAGWVNVDDWTVS